MPGGVVHQASERAIAELTKRAPGMPLAAFQEALGTYSIERSHVPQSAGPVRDDLQEISKAARTLYDRLALASDELQDTLMEECAAFGDVMLPERIKPMLLRLSGLSRNASTEAAKRVRGSRGYSPRTKFIAALARAIEAAGGVADASTSGPLVLAFDVAMEDLGEAVPDSAGTVRKALTSIRKQ